MERLTTRSGFTNEVYLTGKADVCWADRPIEERAFCVGCHRHKGMDRTNCGALMLVDRLAAYEDTGLEPEEIDEVFDEYNDVLKAIIKDGERMITNDRLRELAEADREDAAHIGACGFCEYYQMDKFCCCPDWVEDGYAIIRKPKDYCTKFKKAN